MSWKIGCDTAPFIYANNEPKSALARDLGDCRDNKEKLAKRVFTCLQFIIVTICHFFASTLLTGKNGNVTIFRCSKYLDKNDLILQESGCVGSENERGNTYMKKIGIVTDSHSSISQEEAEKTWNFCPADAVLHRWGVLLRERDPVPRTVFLRSWRRSGYYDVPAITDCSDGNLGQGAGAV